MVVALRGAFVEAVAQHEDVRRFKFDDETSLLAFTRRYGRAVGRQRMRQDVPLRVGTLVALIGVVIISSLDEALSQNSFALYLE